MIGLDGVLLINLVDFWHTVEFSRIRRSPPETHQPARNHWGNSTNLHGSFSPVKPGRSPCSAPVIRDTQVVSVELVVSCEALLRCAVQQEEHYRALFVNAKSGYPCSPSKRPFSRDRRRKSHEYQTSRRGDPPAEPIVRRQRTRPLPRNNPECHLVEPIRLNL